MHIITRPKDDLEHLSRTNRQMLAFRDNQHWHDTEYGMDAGNPAHKLTDMLLGDGFLGVGEFVKAGDAFVKQIGELKARQKLVPSPSDEERDIIWSLAIVYHRLARAHYGQRHWDRGILSSDRSISLSLEIDNSAVNAQATMAMADGYMGKCMYPDAVIYYEKAMLKFREIGNQRNQALAHRGIQDAMQRQHSVFVANVHKEKADKIQFEMSNKVSQGFSRLDDFKWRLINTTAENSETIKLERVTANCIRMRLEKVKKLRRIEEIKEELAVKAKEVAVVQDMLVLIDAQLQEAIDSDKDEMRSSLVHGKEQIFDIEELKVRLRERSEQVGYDCEQAKKAHRAVETRIANSHEEIRVFDEELDVEEGPLMRSVMEKRVLRNVALNPSNTAGNEVTGTASGGVEFVVASEGRTINVFDIHTGTLVTVFDGDNASRHVGETEGHTATITCLCFFEHLVYSGGMDAIIHVWNIETKKRVRALKGHEATVNTIAVDAYKVMSGSADTKVHIWDKATGNLLRVLHGHNRSVNCLDVGHTWFVSGGSEGTVRVWDIDLSDARFRKVKCTQRLRGHGCPVTAVRYGKLEVISGAFDGTIIVWWLGSGEPIQRCKAHQGSVRELQFDATRIVSGGTDCNVVVTDITSGEAVQRLRGHAGPVLAVAFDQVKIISSSADNTLRHWEWGTVAGSKVDKLHVWEQGDNLAKISKKYDVSIPDIIKWNDIKSSANLYAGQRLVVQKGNPLEPTKAEGDAAKRKAKEKSRNKATKSVREVQLDEAKIFHSMENFEEELAVHIIEKDVDPSLKEYGYDAYGDPSTFSARFVKSLSYENQGPHLLDPDMRDETRKSGKQFISKKSLGFRLKKHVEAIEKDARQHGLYPEDDTVARHEAMLNYKTDENFLVDQVWDFVLTTELKEMVKDIALEVTRTSSWPETLNARLLYGQGQSVW